MSDCKKNQPIPIPKEPPSKDNNNNQNKGGGPMGGISLSDKVVSSIAKSIGVIVSIAFAAFVVVQYSCWIDVPYSVEYDNTTSKSVVAAIGIMLPAWTSWVLCRYIY